MRKMHDLAFVGRCGARGASGPGRAPVAFAARSALNATLPRLAPRP